VVTTDYCHRSNGGLYFSGYEEFREIIKELALNPGMAGLGGSRGGASSARTTPLKEWWINTCPR
jgi:hypothetical protein